MVSSNDNIPTVPACIRPKSLRYANIDSALGKVLRYFMYMGLLAYFANAVELHSRCAIKGSFPTSTFWRGWAGDPISLVMHSISLYYLLVLCGRKGVQSAVEASITIGLCAAGNHVYLSLLHWSGLAWAAFPQ